MKNENNNINLEMNSNEGNVIRITNPDHNLESHHYVALNNNNNNNIDYEARTANLSINNAKNQDNLFSYFNFTQEQLEKLSIKIFSDGKRIMLKNAYVLWITYFLIISISLLYFIFV